MLVDVCEGCNLLVDAYVAFNVEESVRTRSK